METIRFINVDVDLESEGGLQALVDALDGKVCILRADDDVVSFELNTSKVMTLEATLSGICKMVRDLPRSVASSWYRARRRVFNIGLQSGDTPYSRVFSISPELLANILRVQGEIKMTVYSVLADPERTDRAVRRKKVLGDPSRRPPRRRRR